MFQLRYPIQKKKHHLTAKELNFHHLVIMMYILLKLQN